MVVWKDFFDYYEEEKIPSLTLSGVMEGMPTRSNYEIDLIKFGDFRKEKRKYRKDFAGITLFL